MSAYVSVQCPYCKTIFNATPGCGTTCKNSDCRAQISVGSDGKIKSSKPPKK